MTMFMERCLSSDTSSTGVWAMINLHLGCSCSSFESLRQRAPQAVCDLNRWSISGRGVIRVDFGSVAFVVCNAAPTFQGATALSPALRGARRRSAGDEIRRLFMDDDYGRISC